MDDGALRRNRLRHRRAAALVGRLAADPRHPSGRPRLGARRGAARLLAGIGAFDYWTNYALGKPTQPEDHSGHGAHSWKDYFRVNTDHKVIGIQYLVTTIFFFLAGGMLALLVRAELARPGMQFFDTQTFNGLFSVHASLMIFLFVIPAFAGSRISWCQVDARRRRHGVPAPTHSFWLLPIAGIMMLASFFVPRCVRLRLTATYRSARRTSPGALLQPGRAVGRRVVDHDRPQLPRHDHHHARAGDHVLADAAARLGELHDLTARRSRHVHRRVAVFLDVRPRDAHVVLPAGRRLSFTSTSSGSRIPRST